MTALDICRYEHDIVQLASLEYNFAKYCTVTVKFLATKDVPTGRTVMSCGVDNTAAGRSPRRLRLLDISASKK